MASVSTSHLILFIASMVVAASVAGTFTTEIQRLSGALGERGLDVSHQIRTDVEVISDAEAGNVYNATNEQTTVLVKNTGSQNLDGDPNNIDVILDGKYQTNVTTSVIGGGAWDVGEVLRVVVNGTVASGDHRLKLIVNEDEEVFEFRT